MVKHVFERRLVDAGQSGRVFLVLPLHEVGANGFGRDTRGRVALATKLRGQWTHAQTFIGKTRTKKQDDDNGEKHANRYLDKFTKAAAKSNDISS